MGEVEQRRALAAADPEEQRRAQQRLEDARRGQLEDLQGRTVGRLKALGRPVPVGLNRWPLESLQAFYEDLLPRNLRPSVARDE